MRIYTTGFTKKSAETFFGSLQQAGVARLLDVRLNNTSQLSGFTKRSDLEYFLRTICQLEYRHIPELAPTSAMLDEYKKRKGSWENYAQEFLTLMQSRRVEKVLDETVLNGGCLLCSEEASVHCHRRLVAEYFQEKWSSVEIVHL